ncbi:hypothetical protein EDB84DRAFT_1599342, partial [Lactarius hengduanensis]
GRGRARRLSGMGFGGVRGRGAVGVAAVTWRVELGAAAAALMAGRRVGLRGGDVAGVGVVVAIEAGGDVARELGRALMGVRRVGLMRRGVAGVVVVGSGGDGGKAGVAVEGKAAAGAGGKRASVAVEGGRDGGDGGGGGRGRGGGRPSQAC